MYMNKYDEKLEQLEQKKARQTTLTAELESAREQHKELEDQAERLNAVYQILRQDVERLEHGRQSTRKQRALEEARAKEQESYGKYSPVKQELDALDDQISRIEQELESLKDVDQDYEEVLRDKQACLQKQGTASFAEIQSHEDEKARLKERQNQVDEAIETGKTVLATAEDLFDCMVHFSSSASTEAVSELHSKLYRRTIEFPSPENGAGDILMAACKIGSMAVAKKKLPLLREQVTTYTKHLSDVEISINDIDLHVNGLLAFADVVIDDWFSDCMVAGRGYSRLEQTRKVVNQIKDTQVRLGEERTVLENEIKQAQDEVDRLVRRSPIPEN